MPRYLQVQAHEKFVGDSTIDLPGGKKLVVEVAEGPNDAMIVSKTLMSSDGQSTRTNTDCYCEGEYIGSADCPGNRVYCNCINKTVSCY